MPVCSYFLYALCAGALVLFIVKTILHSESSLDELNPKLVVVIHDTTTGNFSTPLDPSFELSTTTTTATDPDEPPLILFWNNERFWGPNENLHSLEQIDEALFKVCPVDLQCHITKDRSLIDESSAIVIRLASFVWEQLLANLTRQPDQYFVMVEFERPAVNFGDMTGHEEFFNLTMTYRYDSDVVYPFAYFLPHERRAKDGTELSMEWRRLLNVANGKRKMVAWFVSNCEAHSNRHLVAQRLRTYLDVDIYGACGNLSCPKAYGKYVSSMSCYDMLTRDYKFYLSLENAICKDYITEKFFDILLIPTVIPIVFERKQILDLFRDEEAIASAANSSFIAVDDFESIEELGNYLKYLDRNTTAYLEYFEWRKKYRVVRDRTMTKLPGCELCRIVKEKKPRIFKDIQNWWYKSAECHSYN